MNVEIVMGDTEDGSESPTLLQPTPDPDEYFAKNAFRIVYQTNNFFLPQLKDLIDKGEVLNLRPEYQRRLRWTVLQKSKLIESLLLNIPVPPVFLYETEAARYEVMDGQQRLNAVREFLANDFPLTSLTALSPLNGMTYFRCPPRVKRALDRASLSAIVLLLESEKDKTQAGMSFADIRRFIFDRLNTGGIKLNPQEIRNALNSGIFAKLIIDLTRIPLFTEIFNIPPYVESDPNDYYENPLRQKNNLYSTMGDCQLVLRYFALKDDANIRGSMKSMLDRAMGQTITQHDYVIYHGEYEQRLSFLYDLFDKNPFILKPEDKGRTRVSAAIYDASMVAMNHLWSGRNEIYNDRSNVRSLMNLAIADDNVLPILTGQFNTAKAVKDRIETMRKILRPE